MSIVLILAIVTAAALLYALLAWRTRLPGRAETTLGIAIAFALSTLGTYLSEQGTKKLMGAVTNGRVQDLPPAAFISSMAEMAGRASIAREVYESVLAPVPGIFYKDYSVNLKVDSLEQGAPVSTRREWVRLTIKYRFQIHNPTGTPLMVPFEAVFSDIAASFPGSFDIDIERFAYTPVDAQGGEIPGKATEWGREDIRRHSTVLGDSRLRKMTAPITVGPGEQARVELVVHAPERATGDFSLQVKERTENVRLDVELPGPEFRCDFLFAHKKTDQPECKFELSPDDRGGWAEIRGGVLPYQGITATWGPRADHP